MFEKIVQAIPTIIREAAKSQLALLALLAILVGVLAYKFFGTTKLSPKNTTVLLVVRFGAFLLVFSGVCAFGWAVTQTLPKPLAQIAAAPEGTSTPVGRKREDRSPATRQTMARDALRLQQASFTTALQRAEAIEGTHSVPGNAAQACEAYAEALHLVYQSLNPHEQQIVSSSESQCAKGRSEDHVATLKAVAEKFEHQ